MQLYQTAISQKERVPLEALDRVSEIKMQSLGPISNKLDSIKLSFPEDKYNSLLKQKFALLDQITNEALGIFRIGSGQGVVKAYSILVNAYESTAAEIYNFKPDGKSPEYVTSFQKSMRDIALPLSNKAKEFYNEAVGQISKNDILSNDNALFLIKERQPLPVYRPLKPGILMDKGGGQ
ncbi:MAG: hypothetical protein COW78_10595 [Bdellovibrio sp. CG22_combo_CG10-13_8_21_14_all_39_27]|nr:MAG: hypothetical protein COW78_10595 [Bdellovibrio sp. CG22_combo_CG10-13_8_21_14_all_39_27]